MWLAEILVLLVTENTAHQLDLIKADRQKQSNYDANIQNAREHPLFLKMVEAKKI